MHGSVLPVLLLLTMVAAACTRSSEPAPETIDGSESAGRAVTTLPEPTTAVTEPPIAVDFGADLEAEILTIGLIGQSEGDFQDGVAAYWRQLNATGGVGGRFGVEVVGVEATAAAAASVVAVLGGNLTGLDATLLAVAGSPRGENVVGDLVMPSLSDQLGAVIAIAGEQVTMVVDDTSPELCRDHPANDVVKAEELIGSESAVVLCTSRASTAALLESDATWEQLIILERSWSASFSALAGDRQVAVIGTVPGPGIDQAPAGELIGLVLGDGPWSAALLDGYTRSLSLHAVLERALLNNDLTRAGVLDAVSAVGSDLGFGPGGVSVGSAEAASPTGVAVTEWELSERGSS